ncbi:manganese catalase family protein [Hydrogenibacillus schlegelii]|uniref:Manganese catalase n=1 Tax=Hydrogenibacillus schlegelii TaxID=1484 RepID=A0A132MGB3_HYDSH|nr:MULTISPECIES: manganese catalase family protein [Hydrogenibacillus]KWW96877.1 manganese catalase [Hydrogenibacillus schlegelii]OAR05286.1 manganese catalase [Hydrogenibacillus schlegelii]PTQ54670.1 MAG: Manganese catalase [Hydrogenibacillus schlegelii]QZA34044.1 manganese catalase family protein [Hydrogenibacillus sp. N12]
MYLRIDRLQIELPRVTDPDPDAAAAVQELFGGRFGEMSTLMNYTMQSFNFRQKKALRPYYSLIANIAAEELGHIELVANTVNLLLEGSVDDRPPTEAPLAGGTAKRNSHFSILTGRTALATNSMGAPWQGDYVFNSGDLVLDLLHNFFLENGARMHKLRVYEMTTHPVAREMIGYLLVRGGVHALSYALALESLTGVEVKKLLPIPKISDERIPEAKKYRDQGLHRRLYRFSPDDYREIAALWKGEHPDGGTLDVVDGPPEGGEIPDLAAIPNAFAPGYHPEELAEIAAAIMKRSTRL